MTMIYCPYCGGGCVHVEEHGKKTGGIDWWKCLDCDSYWAQLSTVDESAEPPAPDNHEKTGTWKPLGHRIGILNHPHSEWFQCSLCGYEMYVLYFGPTKRCPHCGAMMDKEDDDGERPDFEGGGAGGAW